jgi:hypothetical protein
MDADKHRSWLGEVWLPIMGEVFHTWKKKGLVNKKDEPSGDKAQLWAAIPSDLLRKMRDACLYRSTWKTFLDGAVAELNRRHET